MELNENKTIKVEENFFIDEKQKQLLRELIISEISIEAILEQIDIRLRDGYLAKCTEEDYENNKKSKDPSLSLFRIGIDKMNNEEQMLYAFLCHENMNSDLKDILDYFTELYQRLVIVNRSNSDYISGHSQEIYSFVLKQASEHYYASKLKVYMTDEDDIEDYEKVELSEEETREKMEDLLQHPLFMTKPPEKIEGNVHLEALQAIKYEDTPQSIADQSLENSKESFKKYLKDKKFNDLKESMYNVVNAIDHCVEDDSVSAVSKLELLLQRADLNQFLKNWNHIIDDMNTATGIILQLNNKNINNSAENKEDDYKADLNNNGLSSIDIEVYLDVVYDRLIQSHINLKKFSTAEKVLEGLKTVKQSLLSNKQISLHGYNAFLKNFYTVKISEINTERGNLKKEIDSQEVFKQFELDEKERLYEALVSLGIKIFPQYHKVPKHCEASIYLDEDDKFHFPVLIAYEEFNITDYIQDITQDALVSDIIEMLFKENLPWDKEKLYSKFSLRVYFEMTKRDQDSSYTTTYYYPLKNNDVIFEVLKNRRVIMNGFPVLSIISTNSKFYEHFLKNKVILKRK